MAYKKCHFEWGRTLRKQLVTVFSEGASWRVGKESKNLLFFVVNLNGTQ